MSAQNYLQFTPNEEVWTAPNKETHTVEVWHNDVSVGQLSFDGPQVFLRGDVKLMFKHILILRVDTNGRLYNGTTQLIEDPQIIKSLDLEMKVGELIFLVKKYVPSTVFIFFDREVDISAGTVNIGNFCNSCVIGANGFPNIDKDILNFLKTQNAPKRERNT